MCVLLERSELTSGSTWHAAGGMHTLNGDPNVAALQQYTVELYEEIQRSPADCGIHLTGGLMLADTDGAAGLAADGPRPQPLPRMEIELISVPRPESCSRCWTRSTSSARCSTPSRATSTLMA